MTLGEKITAARKAAGMTLEDLGNVIGMSKANLSVIENSGLQNGPGVLVLIKIAKALADPTILSHYCDACPVRGEIFIKKFPTLNNINTDPTVIAMKVKQELGEGIEALTPLLDKMLTKNFAKDPEYQTVLEQSMVQIIGTARALEILKEQYMLMNILTPEKLQEIIKRQQSHCEQQGHHVPDVATADFDYPLDRRSCDRRTEV